MTAVLRPVTFAALLLAAPVLAQQPGHSQRLDNMEELRRQITILGHMASGRATYDPARATAAKTALAAAAAGLPMAYESAAADPGFAEKAEQFFTQAEALVSAAEAIDTSTLNRLKAGIGPVAERCTACHQAFGLPR